MSGSGVSDHERRNREFWDADADDYQAAHRPRLDAATWGVWQLPEADLGVLGDVHGLDVLEFGCGDGRWSIHLANGGARVVALDQSRGQLRHARALLDAPPMRGCRWCAPARRPSPCAAARSTSSCAITARCRSATPTAPCPKWRDSSDPGADSCSRTRRRGRTWRGTSSEERVGRRLRRSYFGIRRFDDGAGDGTVDFQLPYGEWIRCFRRHGLMVDDLVELRAPKHASTSYDDFDARWARRWPAEQIWVTRKE